jgi:transcriptional regulator GlxA family with amidase domain
VEWAYCVVDDGIVSSAGVASRVDMAFYVVESLAGKALADETAHYIEYHRDAAPALNLR